jgi:hypothetical protein
MPWGWAVAETPTWAPLVADIIDPGEWSRNSDAFIDEMLANSRCGVGFSVSVYSESATVFGCSFVGDYEPNVSTECGPSDEDIAVTIRRALAAFYVLSGVEAPANVKGGGDV